VNNDDAQRPKTYSQVKYMAMIWYIVHDFPGSVCTLLDRCETA